MRKRLTCLEHFGLRSRRDLRRLGEKHVTVDLCITWSRRGISYRLPVQERLRIDALRRVEARRRVRRDLGIGGRARHWWITCQLPASRIEEALQHPNVYGVDLRGVPGRRRRVPKYPPQLEWYAVLSRYAWQVEGKSKGTQTFEKRILLVRARDVRHARRLAIEEGREYGRPDRGLRRHRTRLEEILGVYETSIETDRFDPRGTEVWSQLHKRPLTKKRAWLPDGR